MIWKNALALLLTWFGVAGSAATLSAAAGELVELADWARAAIFAWEAWEAHVWELVGQLLRLDNASPGRPILPHPLLESLAMTNVFLANIAIGTRIKVFVSGQGEDSLDADNRLVAISSSIFYALPVLIVIVVYVSKGLREFLASGAETLGGSLVQAMGFHGLALWIALQTAPYVIANLSGSDIKFGRRLWSVVFATTAFLFANDLSKIDAGQFWSSVSQATTFERWLGVAFVAAAAYALWSSFALVARAAAPPERSAGLVVPWLLSWGLIVALAALALLKTDHGMGYLIAVPLLWFAPLPGRAVAGDIGTPLGQWVRACAIAATAILLAHLLAFARGWMLLEGFVLWAAILLRQLWMEA